MKNENRDLFGSYTAGYDDLQIKQMMLLPENMTVMALDVDDDDNIIMREAGETPRVYCLVLVAAPTWCRCETARTAVSGCTRFCPAISAA